MQDFRLVLIVVGAIAITALLIHGLWTNYKNKPKALKDKPVPRVDKDDEDSGFDADGIGEVRVISNQSDDNDPLFAKTETDIPSFSAVDEGEAKVASEPAAPTATPTPQAPVETAVESSPVTAAPNEIVPEPIPVEPEPVIEPPVRRPAFTEPVFDRAGNTIAEKPLTVDKPKEKPAPVVSEPAVDPVLEPAAEARPAVEPEAHTASEPLNDKQPDMPTETVEAAPEKPANEPASDEPQDVFVLNVMAPEGQVFDGAVLLPAMLTLGLKFGEMNIFHRHESDSGAGAVLFSLANMVKPGTFDIDNMEQFETHGISLFMAVPCAGQPSANFQLMLHAAEMLAAELNGQVLDVHRQPLTRHTVAHYKDRIQTFERKQAAFN
ncbi:cell division protein ZipA [Motilimonas pumila]|uniref:Cell division protein ZipA n=1 Tax=Motilimonas pumila TaxID=2303987 RepID=A0A418YGX1_9GAMM|nr:cell division protein ZipA [Motilimonas pumila]RJG49108.1 cell division protein ZipA [Motilimonas pumila]